MRSAMPGAGRRPTTSQVQKIQKIQKFQDPWRRVLLVEGLSGLEVRTVTFSSDSSRKWPSWWLAGENLDRSWWGALLCWRILGSVSIWNHATIYPRDMLMVYIFNEYSLYIPCTYMVYTWYIQWCIHIEGIYYVYIMYIHGIYMVYTVMSTYTRNILCIYHVYIWYLHGYTMYIMCICCTWRLMLLKRTGSHSTCSTSNDIFLHSCEYLGFLVKWTCRALLELKIARLEVKIVGGPDVGAPSSVA